GSLPEVRSVPLRFGKENTYSHAPTPNPPPPARRVPPRSVSTPLVGPDLSPPHVIRVHPALLPPRPRGRAGAAPRPAPPRASRSGSTTGRGSRPCCRPRSPRTPGACGGPSSTRHRVATRPASAPPTAPVTPRPTRSPTSSPTAPPAGTPSPSPQASHVGAFCMQVKCMHGEHLPAKPPRGGCP